MSQSANSQSFASMILDFQGFKNEKKSFVIKELVAFDRYIKFHIILNAPFPPDLLSPEREQQGRWVTKHHQALKCEDGTTWILFTLKFRRKHHLLNS